MLLVAFVAHAVIPGLSWPVAFVLGAIVSPTDPTAATAIAQRLGLPRRLVGLIEGESLVNDGTALVAYRYAVLAVVTGSFSLPSASGHFVLSVAGGIAVGLAVGWIIRRSDSASTTPRWRSPSRSSAATSPSCPHTRSASRACSRRSARASTSAGTRSS